MTRLRNAGLVLALLFALAYAPTPASASSDYCAPIAASGGDGVVATGMVDSNGDCQQIPDASDYLCVAPGDVEDGVVPSTAYAFNGDATTTVQTPRTDVYLTVSKSTTLRIRYLDDPRNPFTTEPRGHARLHSYSKIATFQEADLRSFALSAEWQTRIAGLDEELVFDRSTVALDESGMKTYYPAVSSRHGRTGTLTTTFKVSFSTHAYVETTRVPVPKPTFNGNDKRPACAPIPGAIESAAKNGPLYTSRANSGGEADVPPPPEARTFVEGGKVKTYQTTEAGKVVMDDNHAPVVQPVAVMAPQETLVECPPGASPMQTCYTVDYETIEPVAVDISDGVDSAEEEVLQNMGQCISGEGLTPNEKRLIVMSGGCVDGS